MTADQFESARLYAVLAVVAFRLAVMPRYLQSYLNIAYYRFVNQDLDNKSSKFLRSISSVLTKHPVQNCRAETGGGQDLQRGTAAAGGPHILLPVRGDPAVRRPHDSGPLPRAHVQDHGRRHLDW